MKYIYEFIYIINLARFYVDMYIADYYVFKLASVKRSNSPR
jgi:hypothetical protein